MKNTDLRKIVHKENGVKHYNPYPSIIYSYVLFREGLKFRFLVKIHNRPLFVNL